MRLLTVSTIVTGSLLIGTPTLIQAKEWSPFFRQDHPGIHMEVDANANPEKYHAIQKLNELRQLHFRRQLAVGNHPNLPNGGSVGGHTNNYNYNDYYSDNDTQKGEHHVHMTVDFPEGHASTTVEFPDKNVPPSSTGKGFLGKTKSSKKGKGAFKTDSKSKGGKGSKKSGKGKSKGKGSSKDKYEWEGKVEPEGCTCTPGYCDCEGGGDGVHADYEFVLLRDEIGSDSLEGEELGVASGIGLNGHVYKMVYTKHGRDFGGDPIGVFKGFCTVVSALNGELLCTYEIYLYSNGETGIGGVIVTGPVAGLETGQEFESVVTGAEFDFSIFSTGFLTTVQDPQKPILYSFLSLYL